MERRVIRAEGVHFGYPGGAAVLEALSLGVEPGLTLLVGPNGCGKSTLLRLLAGVERPDQGTITIDGADLWSDEALARRGVAYLPEYPDVTPYATVEELIVLVARLRHEPLEMARHALTRVGLDGLGHRSIRELSFGQRRRVLLAAAHVGRPTHLLLDEPLEALDRALRDLTVGWVADRLAAGATIVLAAHDFTPFLARADRALTLRERKPVVRELLPSDPAERVRALEELAR